MACGCRRWRTSGRRCACCPRRCRTPEARHADAPVAHGCGSADSPVDIATGRARTARFDRRSAVAARRPGSGPGRAGGSVRGPDARHAERGRAGHALRDGLERVLRGNTGGLIVLGMDRTVESLCTGGFVLDVEFTATRLRELCKLDGALILDRDITKIVRAGVQLVPDASIPTEETGTRHRTAQRVSIQTGFPVVSVSQSMRLIALYVDGQRRVLEDSAAILSRANQALATLERYKLRLDEVAGTLSALEIEDLVTVRDVGGGRPAAGDGAPDRHRDRRVRGGAGHGRAAAVAPAGRADRGGGAGAASWSSGTTCREPAGASRSRTVRRGARRAGPAHPHRAARTAHGGPGAGLQRRRPRRWTPRSRRAASGCWRRCRGCRGRSSTGWWTTSAGCRSCSRRAWTTSRRWTASARPGPVRSARASPGWPSPRSSSVTSERRPAPCRARAGSRRAAPGRPHHGVGGPGVPWAGPDAI